MRIIYCRCHQTVVLTLLPASLLRHIGTSATWMGEAVTGCRINTTFALSLPSGAGALKIQMYGQVVVSYGCFPELGSHTTQQIGEIVCKEADRCVQ